MPKLHQIVAIVSGKKTRASKLLTDSHQGWKPDLIKGMSRSYQPIDAEGDKIPDENQTIQVRVSEVINKVVADLKDAFDIVATQEKGNTIACADVVVDNVTVLSKVPVGTLLFLEKQLTDIETFVKNIPTLTPDKEWEWDANQNCFATKPVTQLRSIKVHQTHVKFPPTEHHPGQADILQVDKGVGYYTTRHYSSAIPASEQAKLLTRVVKLQDAVKMAREEANSIDVSNQSIGENVFKFIFG